MRKHAAYENTSYAAFDTLARNKLLDFVRVLEVERGGRTVLRHVTSPDLTPEERSRYTGSSCDGERCAERHTG